MFCCPRPGQQGAKLSCYASCVKSPLVNEYGTPDRDYSSRVYYHIFTLKQMFEFNRSIQWKGISVRGMGGLALSSRNKLYCVQRKSRARTLSRVSLQDLVPYEGNRLTRQKKWSLHTEILCVSWLPSVHLLPLIGLINRAPIT